MEKTRKRRSLIFDYTIPQKVPYETRWKHNQDAVYWERLSKVQDQGLHFWHTQSFSIMVYATIPRDCIDRVTAQNGDRILFERLAMRHQGPHPRSRGSGIGKASSRSSSFHTQTYLASGNTEQRGKARQKCKTTRNTSKKRTKPPGNWCIPLVT